MKCDILREKKHRMTKSIVSASPRIDRITTSDVDLMLK